MKLLHLLALIGASAALSQAHEVEIDILQADPAILREEPNTLPKETNKLRYRPPILMADPKVVQHGPEMLDSIEEVPYVADRDLLFGIGDNSKVPAQPPSVFQLRYLGPTPSIVMRAFANVSNILNSVIQSRPAFKLKKKLVPRDDCFIRQLSGKFVLKPTTLHSIPLFVTAGPSDGVGGTIARTLSCLHYQTAEGRPRNAVAVIFYDPADVNSRTDPTQLQQILLHEAIHALGFGIIWNQFLYPMNGTYWYAGINAVYEYRELLPKDDEGRKNGLIPVEDTETPGSYGTHWRSSVFGDELMAAFYRGQKHMFSRMTAKAIEDFGYSINYNSPYIEPYTIPTAEEMENILAGRDRNSYIRGLESD